MRLNAKQGSTLRTLRAAFPHTLPVLTGYLFLGMAFGILLQSKGYGAAYAGLMSVFVYAGSMQFVAVGILGGGIPLITVALMTLAINSRHVFYGLTMLEKFHGIKHPKKAYLIFSLTDETYALLCAQTVPDGIDKGYFFFFIALLNHLYWITGSVVGAAASSLLAFDSTGIEFAMTSLFIVILTEQLKAGRRYITAAIGGSCAVVCLVIFGADGFILPAMLLTAVMLMLMRKHIDTKAGTQT